MFLFELAANLISLSVGCLYPAYLSFKAIRTRDTRRVVTLLIYWIVFVLYSMSQSVFGLLFSWVIPFYTEINTLLIIFLVIPDCRGALYVYRRFIHPFLVNNEANFDKGLEDIQDTSRQVGLWLAHHGFEALQNLLSQYLRIDTNQILSEATANGAPTNRNSDNTNINGNINGNNNNTNDNNMNVNNRLNIPQAIPVQVDSDEEYPIATVVNETVVNETLLIGVDNRGIRQRPTPPTDLPPSYEDVINEGGSYPNTNRMNTFPSTNNRNTAPQQPQQNTSGQYQTWGGMISSFMAGYMQQQQRPHVH